MKVYHVWVGIHGHDWYALARADSETEAITKLMKQIGNAAEAVILTPQLAEELELTEELAVFEAGNRTLHIYANDEE